MEKFFSKNYLSQCAMLFLCVSFIRVNAFAEKYAGEFLNIGAGVRALGMGGAFTGISDDSTAAYWNPAGLGQSDRGELTLMYSNMFINSDMPNGAFKYGFVNGVTHNLGIPFGFPFLLPFKNYHIPGHFGISWVTVLVPDLPYLPQSAENDVLLAAQNLDALVANTTYGNDQEHGIYLSYGFPKSFFGVLALGLNVKIIQQKISFSGVSYSANGTGFDLGLLYTGLKSRGIRVGLNLQDITQTPIKWNTGQTDKIPMSVKFGLAYTTKLPLTSQANIAVDMDTKYGNSTYFGTELWFVNMIALRVGYRQLGGPKTTVNNLTAGFGFRFLSHYTFDYAFLGLFDNDLGDTQRASLSIKF